MISAPNVEEKPEHVDEAENLLKDYLVEYADIYGYEAPTFNTHNLLHVTNSVRRFGNVNNFSNNKFEIFFARNKEAHKNAEKNPPTSSQQAV